MSFETKIRRRIILNGALAGAGLLLIAFGLFMSLRYSSGFSEGYFTGLGFSFVMGAGISIFKNRRLLRDSKKLNALRIAEQDERNALVGLKSSHYAFLAAILVLFAGSVYYAFVDQTAETFFAGGLLLLAAIKVISGVVLSRRM